MKIYHTSTNKIEKINSHGMFGDCLFFSADIYVMTAAHKYLVYSIEIDDDKMIKRCNLYDEEIVREIEREFGVDAEVAEGLLDGSESEWDYDCDAEKSWWLQGKQGECAKAMGFEACIAKDEQGTVYIVPMMNREKDLVLEKTVDTKNIID